MIFARKIVVEGVLKLVVADSCPVLESVVASLNGPISCGLLSFEVKFEHFLEFPIRLKSTVRKYLEFGLLSALAVAIVWWFGRKLDWGEVRLAISLANWYLLGLAVVVICLSYLFRACRWGALLAPLGPAKLRHLFAATTVGFGAVFLIGRMAEVVRPVVLPMREPRVRASASFVTIIVERIYDTMAVVVLFALNLLWFTPPSNNATEFSRVRIVGLVLLTAAVSGVLSLTWFRRRSTSAIGWVEKFLKRRSFIPGRLTKAVVSILEQLARALRVLVNARELAITIGWTAMVWGAIALANLTVLRAFGLPFGIREAIFVLGWSLVGSLVPTPGGAAGAFHAATAAGLIFLGVPRETAAAISIVMHLIDFGPSLVFSFFYLIRGDINFSRLRSLSSSEAVEHAVEDESITPDDDVLVERQLETVAASD